MLKVFLNHASEDRALVLPYFEKLKALGYEPWIDKRLLPGQNWDEEIQRAFNAADVILVFMSPRSVVKRGYVQREINDALDRQRYLLPGDIGLIPLMLEECDVPTKIAKAFQFIRVPQEWSRVVEALELAALQRSIAINTGVEIGPFRMFIREDHQEWEGLPGFDVSLKYPHVESTLLPNSALELNEYFSSLRLECLIDARRAKMDQEPDYFAGWMNNRDSTPKNSHDRYIYPGLVSDSILSFSAYESGMFAGAAHGFNSVETHNFLILDDCLTRISFADFFADPHAGLPSITTLLRAKISQEWRERFEEEPGSDDLNEINESFPEDWDTFKRFTVSTTDFTLIFPPYTLGGYAAGTWVVTLQFAELQEWLKLGGPHTLAEQAIVPSWDTDETPEQVESA